MTLSLPTCRKALRALLRLELATLGFVAKGPSPFTRPCPLGTEIFRLPDRRDPMHCYFGLSIGISIQSIEEILRPGSKDILSTIWVPIHFLNANREFLEWTMADESDAPDVAAAIMEEVQAYALPFFEEHRRLEAIKRKLESPSPRDWFVLGPGQRICVLAAMEYLEGHVDKSFGILEASIEAENAKPIPRNQPMQRLLTELRARETATSAAPAHL